MFDQDKLGSLRKETCFLGCNLVLHRANNAIKVDLFSPARNQGNSQIFLRKVMLSKSSVFMNAFGNIRATPVMNKEATFGYIDQLP